MQEIVRRLIEAYDPERIYLFGSRARGDVGPDSDYDLMVIVWTRSRLNARRHIAAALPAIVLREGRLLYAA